MQPPRSLTQSTLGREPHPVTRLLRRVTVANRRVEKALSQHLGVNATDYRTMSMLLNRGTMTPSELAARLAVSPALISLSLERLEGMGHVERRRGSIDRRRRTVTASSGSAATVRDRLMPVVAASESCLEDFDDEQVAAVETYLRRVLAALDECLDDLNHRPGGGDAGSSPLEADRA